MRRDHRILRAISLSPDWSDQMFVRWTTAPLLDVDASDAMHKMFRDKQGEIVPAWAGTDALPLPFREGVVEVKVYATHPGSADFFMWRQVNPTEHVAVHPGGNPVKQMMELICAVADDATGGVHPPICALIGCDDGGALAVALGPVPAGRSRQWASQLVTACYAQLGVVLDATYASAEHLVESRGPTAITPRQFKTIKHKPWLRDDLPEITLMAGPPREVLDQIRRGPIGKPRHAPKPHSRRGHWRRLRSGKRVFVRAMWIGPQQWTMGGRTYRLVVPPDGHQGVDVLPG